MTNNKPEKLVDIRVYGVGGGGSNAVTRMYNEDNSTVEYFIINTDTFQAFFIGKPYLSIFLLNFMYHIDSWLMSSS